MNRSPIDSATIAAEIAVDRLGVSVGRVEILRDVSFSVESGEYVAIVGPNGAGKTTLLKCLMRIITHATGRIAVAGRDLHTYSQRDLARRISYVPQAGGAVFPFSVEEFVLLGRYPYYNPLAATTQVDRDAVVEAMETTGVRRLASRRLDTLSGGERQKVFLAASLAQQAGILLLDEPTTFLDYRHQQEIADLLARLHEESRATIIAVTHDVNRAAIDAGRILAMRGGEIVYDGRPSGLLEEAQLQSVYDTTFTFVPHPDASVPMIVPQKPPMRS